MIAAVETYLAVRRAAGFILSNTEYLLRSFAGFAADQKQTHIRTATAIDWASQARSVEQHIRVSRPYAVLRSTFASRTSASNCRPQTTSAIERFVEFRAPILAMKFLILSSRPQGLPSSDSLRPGTYAALISLLAATGLRISEALHLLVSDITPDGLLIRKTKFQKTRLVPLHDTAVAETRCANR